MLRIKLRAKQKYENSFCYKDTIFVSDHLDLFHPVRELNKFITGCGYTFESFGGLQKRYSFFFLFIALLSFMIDNTWKPISSKPIIIHLAMSNKFSALKHLVGITCTTSLYCENTLSIKTKVFVAASL